MDAGLSGDTCSEQPRFPFRARMQILSFLFGNYVGVYFLKTSYNSFGVCGERLKVIKNRRHLS